MQRRVRFLFGLCLAELLLGVGQLQLRLFTLDVRNNLLFAGFKFGAFHVIAGFQHGGFVFLCGQARLGASLSDLRLRRFQAGAELRQILLRFCLVELHHDIPGLHHGTFRRDFHDLQIAGLRRAR